MPVVNLKKQNGVYIPEGIFQDTGFEKLYLSVREKEQRVFNNHELLLLPEVGAGHKFYREWSVRKESCKKLVTYLTKKNRFLKILEIGCGNGWLSHRLAEIPQTEVTGLDVNLTELQQAASVFTNSNLQFVYGDLRNHILPDMQFDIIVFAASIPYFPSFDEIINLALKYLRTDGEIHIIDSFFYEAKDIPGVRQNCVKYYEDCGFPEMANFFFHHLIDDVYQFHYTLMQPRNSFFKKLFNKKNMFPWIRICI